MSAYPRHWRRPLRYGGMEFFFAAQPGETMRGSLAPAGPQGELVTALQRHFERFYGVELPEPELRPLRPGRRTG